MLRPCLIAVLFVAAGCITSDAAREGRSVKTAAPNTVTHEDSQNRGLARVEEMLRGQIAGVHVSEEAGGLRIRIRGGGTEGLSLMTSEPLFVIDGLPLTRTRDALVGINPNDVESITVLKNASETAFYGSRGANGVILITTRRPGPSDA